MRFLLFLSDMELAVLRWSLAPVAVFLPVLGLAALIVPFAAYRKTRGDFVDAERLPAAPHIFHVVFAYEAEGETYESATRRTYDIRQVERRFEGRTGVRLYYRKKDPSEIRTSRGPVLAMGFSALAIGLVLGVADLALFGLIALPF